MRASHTLAGEVSQYPQTPGKVVADRSSQAEPATIAGVESLLRRLLEEIKPEKRNRQSFDTYRPQSVVGEVLPAGQPLTIASDFELQEVRTIIVTGPIGAAGSSSQEATGSVPTPAGNVVIAHTQGVPFTGLYQIGWTVGIEGAAATLADNFQLKLTIPNQTLSNSENGTAVGDYTQQPVIAFLQAGQVVNVTSNAAETTATYSADLTVTPYGGNIPFILQLGDRVWDIALPPAGILFLRANPGLNIKQADVKQLTPSVGGNWAVEMTGYKDYQ